MNEDVRTFLSRFTVEELVAHGALQTSPRWGYLLRAASVTPLVDLMKKESVSKLEAIDRDWFLTSEYEFRNPQSTEFSSGDARQLSNPGNVFWLQNRHLNPYFMKTDAADVGEADGETSEVVADAEAITFGLERDLQSALCTHINQLEPGLRIVDGGSERTVESGRIDITAEDVDGHIVVIELKAGTAPPESMTQVLAYMGAVGQEEQKPVRGILVAKDFHRRVVFAAQAVANVQLKKYTFQFQFADP
ncbi:MAG: hypothetical protein BZY75_05565 [SAR202 cluster bacterium Io17-Chloro-G7]|nr:MAG: hypothetical protein BZY75_05565 [SAR202 cluster bacterium Io17-Chloro-G7]